MATSQAKRALRQQRRENSLCIHCGAEAILDQTRCTRCVERDNAVRRRCATRALSAGLCKNLGCHNATNGHNYCDNCNQKSAQHTALRRQRRKQAGWCVVCGLAPRWRGLTRCEPCHNRMLESARRLTRRRQEAGLCPSCGALPDEGYKSCRRCITERSAEHAKLKLEVLAAYGGPYCNGCTETEIEVLQMDHVNGGGHRHAKEIGGRGKMYKWLKDHGFPPGFRVLCANCNIRAHRRKPFPNDVLRACSPTGL